MLLKKITSVVLCWVYLLLSVFLCTNQSAADQKSSARTFKAASSVTDEQETSGQQKLLATEISHLTPVMSEMADALGLLHAIYPQQIQFWKSTLSSLPADHPQLTRITELMGQAEIVLPSFINYAQVVGTQRRKLEALLPAGHSPGPNHIDTYSSLALIYQLQEKIGFYEIAFQETLNELSQAMYTQWPDPKSSEFQALQTFKQTCTTQVARYLNAHKKFDDITLAVRKLSEAFTLELRSSTLEDAIINIRLAQETIKARQTQGKDFGLNLALSTEIEEIARRRALEGLALDSAIAQRYDGSMLLFALCASSQTE